jgi:hypothetical protein
LNHGKHGNEEWGNDFHAAQPINPRPEFNLPFQPGHR